tara:strand:- start:5872 stop:6783 length:912 start_codon:yes stop_codon:yes gene_type:complete
MNRTIGIGIAVLILAGTGYLAAEFIVNSRIKGEIDAEIERHREDADISYGKFRYDLASSSARMSQFQIEGKKGQKGKVTVDEMIVDDFKPRTEDESFPSMLNFKALGIQLSEEVNPELSEELKELGYEEPPRMDAAIDYEYNLETKQLDIRKAALMGDDMGELSISLSLTNFTPPPTPPPGEELNPLQLMAMLSALSIQSCEITFRDNGITNRFLDRGAETAGVTRDEFVTSLIADLREGLKSDSSTLNRQALASVEQFLDDPDQLKVTIQPASPISVASIVAAKFLGGGAQIPQMLGIEVSN